MAFRHEPPSAINNIDKNPTRSRKVFEPVPSHPFHTDLSKGDALVKKGIVDNKIHLCLGQPPHGVVADEGRKVHTLGEQDGIIKISTTSH